jgi:hypothetical protein
MGADESLQPVVRESGRIGDELFAHLAGLMGSKVKVTLEIEAGIPTGTPNHVVRTVTENSRALRSVNRGFEVIGGGRRLPGLELEA